MGSLIAFALLVAAAQSGVMVGVFFTSGQLLPTALAPVYAALPATWMRVIAAGIFVFPICNWAVSYAFANYNPALVSPMMAAFAVMANVGFTILVIGVRPSLWMIPALALLTGAAVWVSLLLSQKPA